MEHSQPVEQSKQESKTPGSNSDRNIYHSCREAVLHHWNPLGFPKTARSACAEEVRLYSWGQVQQMAEPGEEDGK